MKLPLEHPKPNVENFIRVIRGEVVPERPPLVELFLDHEIVREISSSILGRGWVEPGETWDSQVSYLNNWTEVYHRMGYDYVRLSGGLDFPAKWRLCPDTADLSRGSRAWAEQGTGPIASWEDFEQYPWPDPDKADLWSYEFVAANLPEGMGLFVCPTSGFLEVPMEILLGCENMCFLLYDDPELLSAVMSKTGDIIYRFYERLLGLPNLRGFFQGDDMGYKTGTIIAADDIRKYVLPWHQKLAALAHDNGLVYLLHSCGRLGQIMDDLINEVKIDGRHSYEDASNSVIDFKYDYGDNVAVLGGIDVHKLATFSEADLRGHVRGVIEKCMPRGRFALGSGNTVCNYVPIRNYFAMVDEGLSWS